jgi:hypothetical protein
MSWQGEGKDWFVASDLNIPTSHTIIDLAFQISLQT